MIFTGLYNVNERIQLRFGEEYGLRIQSRYGEGTLVEVYLPYSERTSVKKYTTLKKIM